MAFVLPPKKEVGYLDPEIAGEGAKVITGDGEVLTFNPPPPKPVMPDPSEIKKIRHYFNRIYPKTQVWPAWLYHPTEPPRIVKNADEAAELGVCYRPTDADERMQFGLEYVWDWKEDSKWRPKPYTAKRHYDPAHPETGKEYIATPMAQSAANRQMLDQVLPEVTAAVVAALKQGGSVAPNKVDPKQWDEFLAFQAWQKTKEAIDTIDETTESPAGNALTASPDQERAAWEAEAERKGLKVDHRWSLETLKERVQKAA